MGSAKVSIVKPQTMENKSFKPIAFIKSILHIDKKKEKAREREQINKQKEPKEKPEPKKAETTVASILEPFKELNIKTTKKVTEKEDVKKTKAIFEEEAEDELENFTFKIIKNDRRSNRIYSQSSEDSGYADSDVVETLQKLTLHEKEGDDKETETKDKKTRQVLVKRAPIRSKVSGYSAHPYPKVAESEPIRQINKQSLSGGIVTENRTANNCFEQELDEALESVAVLYQSNPNFWEDMLDVISKDTNIQSEFPQITGERIRIDIIPENIQIPNPVDEFSSSKHLLDYDDTLELTLDSILNSASTQFPINQSGNDSQPGYPTFKEHESPNIFPTPPRSENISSPLSESQAFYTSYSEYTPSPEPSSPIYNSDFENYQEISSLPFDESFEDNEISRDRASQRSHSSMTMKNFKDLQKEIANEFSKKECCDINRKSTKEIFEDHMQKLKDVERKNLCLKVSKLDLKSAYGVLHTILMTLSRECEKEDLNYTLFALVCQTVLAKKPELFAGDFGLSILIAAALRCPHRPLLTRHIVHCVYMVQRSNPKLCTKDCVFHEVDAQGDNLVIACARGGDAYALVLAEITRSDSRGELPPLFRLHHANSDGYTALHVACREHSTSSSRLHTVHVLLEHANADVWKGDIKGGDTAVHLAANSSTCCLELVLMLFKYQDRKLWKKLANSHNMSSVSPMEYARSAIKSTTRQNYPHEVLSFFKKCR